MVEISTDTSGTTYQGSLIFSSIAKMAGLPIDQFNFVFSEILALIMAILFRRFLPPGSANTMKRHIVASFLGIALCYFCYGMPMWHIILQSSVVYAMLHIIPATYAHLAIFVFCMGYMSAIHIHRLIYDYGNYTLDVSGPLMINTQKLTAFAFAIYDGYRSKQRAKLQKPDDVGKNLTLNADQEKQKIQEIPSPIVFLSYVFYFHGIIVGPLCFFRDYCDFIEGRNLLVVPLNKSSNEQQASSELKQPSTLWPVCKKLLQAAVWVILLTVYTPNYTVEYNLSEVMINSPLYKRVSYLLFSTFCTRVKYYFAFILAEVVNNAAGLGFNGYDDKGGAKWDLITNVRAFELETATSLKVIIDMWNIQTGLWLRRVCYDRLPNGRTFGVFVLSAVWHGFYPGYYVCFTLGALETYAGRGIRRHIRPLFQKNSITKLIYACLTWLGAQIGLNFATAPFVLLEFRKAWQLYASWYFSVPIIILLFALLLPGESSKPKTKNEQGEKDKNKRH